MNAHVIPVQSTSAKGQVTIPMAIRKKLGLAEGSKVRFVERGDHVLLEKVETDLATLCGLLTAPRSVPLGAMDDAIGDAIAEKFVRSADPPRRAQR